MAEVWSRYDGLHGEKSMDRTGRCRRVAQDTSHPTWRDETAVLRGHVLRLRVAVSAAIRFVCGRTLAFSPCDMLAFCYPCMCRYLGVGRGKRGTRHAHGHAHGVRSRCASAHAQSARTTAHVDRRAKAVQSQYFKQYTYYFNTPVNSPPTHGPQHVV